MKPIRLGIVGTGWIADALTDGLAEVSGMIPAAVCSRKEETGRAFAKKHQIPAVFTDSLQMAQSDAIDAVYLASPNVLHASQSRVFLENGKHVLCEKPFTVNPRQAEELYALAEEKGLILLEAIMMMHLPARKALHEAIEKIGNIHFAKFDFSQLSSKYDAFQRGELPNIFNPQLATGALMDLGVYCVYPALELFGMPDSISASAGFLSSGADGWGSAVLEYTDLQVLLSYSKVGQAMGISEIQGDRGTVYTPSISKLTELKLTFRDGSTEQLSFDEPKPHLMACEALDFYRFITEPQLTRKEYEVCRERTLQVSKVMYEIRQKAGIHFPCDEN